MLVDLDYIASLKKKFTQINAEEIKNMTFVSRGETVKFHEKDLKEFKFMGFKYYVKLYNKNECNSRL